MEKFLEGIEKFRNEDYVSYKDLFEELKDKQNPHTLFISCSDSRIDPSLITKTQPGELFIIRNIANIVPPYREAEEYLATTSSIEYAVLFLDVENIIVCGHSNCGGCAASLKPDILEKLPHTKKWLELCNPVRDRVLRENKNEKLKVIEWLMEQSNVLEQLKNLLTYPYIKERVLDGKLTINGWYYIIKTGEIYIYNKEIYKFILAN